MFYLLLLKLPNPWHHLCTLIINKSLVINKYIFKGKREQIKTKMILQEIIKIFLGFIFLIIQNIITVFNLIIYLLKGYQRTALISVNLELS